MKKSDYGRWFREFGNSLMLAVIVLLFFGHTFLRLSTFNLSTFAILFYVLIGFVLWINLFADHDFCSDTEPTVFLCDNALRQTAHSVITGLYVGYNANILNGIFLWCILMLYQFIIAVAHIRIVYNIQKRKKNPGNNDTLIT